jgi:hypothetical protein
MKLSTPLFNLPRSTIPAPDGPTSLPQRNLLRHVTWLLPSGQSIARAIDVEALSLADLRELKDLDRQLQLNEATPLWYYALKEAQVVEHGRQLGPVGGRIVGEVILGLLQARPACLPGGQSAVAPDAADHERSGHRRVPDDRLSHLCRRGSRQSQAGDTGGPCRWAPRPRGPPHCAPAPG